MKLQGALALSFLLVSLLVQHSEASKLISVKIGMLFIANIYYLEFNNSRCYGFRTEHYT